MNRTPYPGASIITSEVQSDLSFSERKARKGGNPPAASQLVEGNHLLRPIDRAPPGDVIRRTSRAQPRGDLARQKSKRNFFEDAFSITPSSPARERVHGDAIVMAEVGDEHTFINELSNHLSTRYQRPVSSIVVTLHHGACMLFGGSFDAAYVMSVFALPSQLQPTTNKRNAALIQKHMEETLGVDPARGLLRFVATPEEHLACNGKTTAGEIDELERSFQNDGAGGWATASSPAAAAADEWAIGLGGPTKGTMARKKLSVSALAPLRHASPANVPAPELTPPGSADGAVTPTLGPEPASRDPSPRRRKSAQRKKSFVASIFGRPGSKSSDPRSSLPAIADERQA